MHDRIPVFPENRFDWMHDIQTFRRFVSTQWRRVAGLNLSQVDDLLYVGGEFTPRQWARIRQCGVRAVLSLQAERVDRFEGPPPERSLRLDVEDFTPPTLAQLDQAVDFIDGARGQGLPVLVHCHAGVGRAPLTAAAWLVTQGYSHGEAFARIRAARPIAVLNSQQYGRLIEWEAFQRGRTPGAA